jgi:hypothetical protein
MISGSIQTGFWCNREMWHLINFSLRDFITEQIQQLPANGSMNFRTLYMILTIIQIQNKNKFDHQRIKLNTLQLQLNIPSHQLEPSQANWQYQVSKKNTNSIHEAHGPWSAMTLSQDKRYQPYQKHYPFQTTE